MSDKSKNGDAKQMLTQFIQAAMHRATYELLKDQSFYGEIPGFAGVYANAPTLEACRDQLQEVLEGWIVLGLRLGHTMPILDGIRLDVGVEVA
jgi:predicted RNase H-like HicB family nuclease